MLKVTQNLLLEIDQILNSVTSDNIEQFESKIESLILETQKISFGEYSSEKAVLLEQYLIKFQKLAELLTVIKTGLSKDSSQEAVESEKIQNYHK